MIFRFFPDNFEKKSLFQGNVKSVQLADQVGEQIRIEQTHALKHTHNKKVALNDGSRISRPQKVTFFYWPTLSKLLSLSVI